MNYNELDEDRPLFSSEFNAHSQTPVTFTIFDLFLSQDLNDSLKFYCFLSDILFDTLGFFS